MSRLVLVTLVLLAVSVTLVVSDGVAQQTPAIPKAGDAIKQMAKLDLNKATDAQLKALPGLSGDDLVSKVKAARPFKQVEDLKKVIPEPVYEQVKNLVMVTP
ncbi:MAG: ComEA family DNA-binding protein [Candidatus Rokuibacteriota bacterium]